MRVSAPDLIRMRQQNQRITMLTAYDYQSAKLVDSAGIDAVLVGDSLGTVIQGNEHTLSVSLEDMMYHTRLVSRACKRALVIADLPFMTYQLGIHQTLENAGRLIKEAGATAVKLEGGVPETVAPLVEAGIPVLGHLGLMPQRYHVLGGYKVQGRTRDDSQRILQQAKELEEAGAFGLVLEAIPSSLAEQVTNALRIPTIGIGAGPHCSGQVLVFHDVLGLTEQTPKFVRRYAELGSVMSKAIEEYAEDVRQGSFPGVKEQY